MSHQTAHLSPAEALDLHGERAAIRGNPSLVWRAGQDRRMAMILMAAPRGMRRVLVDGCGVGMYVRALLEAGGFGQDFEVHGLDIEAEHLALAATNVPQGRYLLAAGEDKPYADGTFDLVLSHEVLEHVADDRAVVAEIVRVLRPGGRAVIFVPNRLYPFETHGIYVQGQYYFGNAPLVNWLPNSLRNRLAPHVRAYTVRGLQDLFLGHPVRVLQQTQIYPGFDNVVYRRPRLGKTLRTITYALERSPARVFGLSHLMVVEKYGS
ncbi:MAG: class I SAM-dependent methyltransferase [Caldilineaceae bacterium]